MGYVLLIDSIDYAIWVMILLSLVPFAKTFNSWTNADGSILDKLSSSSILTNRKQEEFSIFPNSLILCTWFQG